LQQARIARKIGVNGGGKHGRKLNKQRIIFLKFFKSEKILTESMIFPFQNLLKYIFYWNKINNI